MGEREDAFLKAMGMDEYLDMPEMDRTFKQAIEDIAHRLIFEGGKTDELVRKYIYELFSESIEKSIKDMRQEYIDGE